MATRCFQVMNEKLRHNMLDLGTPDRFLTNAEGLAASGITDTQLNERIPQELRYACIYWANHLQSSDIEHAALTKDLELFAGEHLLHWLEALSLICKLKVASRAVGVPLKLLVKLYVTPHACSGADASPRNPLLPTWPIFSMMPCASYRGLMSSSNNRHFIHTIPLSPLRQRRASCIINTTKIGCIIFVN